MRKIGKIVISFILIISMMYSPFTTTTSSYAAGVESFIGSIAIFPYDFTPLGWMRCEGQELQISNNTALFSIIGTEYGGNGISTFNIPNLKNKAAKNMHYAICTEGRYGLGGMIPIVSSIELVPNRYIQNDQTNGWLPCDGRQVSISAYDTLYTLIGMTFGGDGVSNFKLPNLSLYSPISGYTYMISTTGIYPNDYLSGSDEFRGSFILMPIKKSFADAQPCEGQDLSVAQNTALYALLGARFGGTGSGYFKMPYLNKHVPNNKFQYYILTGGIFPSRD